MVINGSYSEEGGLIHWKASDGLEPAGSQKHRKTGETWKKDSCRGRENMQQNVGGGVEVEV